MQVPPKATSVTIETIDSIFGEYTVYSESVEKILTRFKFRGLAKICQYLFLYVT